MIGWLLGKAAAWTLGRAVAVKALLVAVPLLLLAGGGAVWYAKHLYDSRLVAQQAAAGWKIAAVGWSREFEAWKARQAATDALRLRRERERNERARSFGAVREEIGRLRHEDDQVRDYLDERMPDALDQRLCDAERAAGAACGARSPAG